jgi:hypothetical protein
MRMKQQTKIKLAGATAGVAGALGAVSTVPLFAPTLGTVAVLVGGGLTTGVAIVASAPLAIVGVAYGLYQWLRD